MDVTSNYTITWHFTLDVYIGRIWAIRLQWEWFSIVLIVFIIHELVGADGCYFKLVTFITSMLLQGIGPIRLPWEWFPIVLLSDV